MNRENEIQRDPFNGLPMVELESFGPNARDFSYIARLSGGEQTQAVASLPIVDRKTLELYREESALCKIFIRFNLHALALLWPITTEAQAEIEIQSQKVIGLQVELRVTREQEV